MHRCPRVGCDRVFTRKANLIGHLNAHDGFQPYQCSTCSARFTRRNEQRAHEREQHSDIWARQSFSCHVCGTAFGRKSTLNRHLGIPSGLRRCPKQAIVPVQTLQRNDSAIVAWRSSLSSRVVKPTWFITQYNSNDHDAEDQAGYEAQHARQNSYPGARYLTEYRATTDNFYDWTVVSLKAVVDSIDALYSLLSLSGPGDFTDILYAIIATQYERIMHSAITLLTKAPLQLASPLIEALRVLDILRENAKGRKILDKIFDEIVGRLDLQRNLIQYPPDKVCIPEVIQVDEKLRQDCGRVLSVQPSSKDAKGSGLLAPALMDILTRLVYFTHATLLVHTSIFFRCWGLLAVEGGYDHQAEVAKALYKRLDLSAIELARFSSRFWDGNDFELPEAFMTLP